MRTLGFGGDPSYRRRVAIAPFPDRGRSPRARPTPKAGPTRVSRLIRRVSDGQHLWGTIDVSPANRSVWSRTHLTVYAPGTNTAERRRLRLFHSWPIVGAVLGILVMVALDSWPPLIAFGVGIAVYAVGFWPVTAMTARLRRANRHVVVSVVDIGERYQQTGDLELLRSCVRILSDLEEGLARGTMTPVEFEACWAEVYRLIPVNSPSPRGRSDSPSRGL